eukprot:jgi/Mesen1/6953/ME000360S06212
MKEALDSIDGRQPKKKEIEHNNLNKRLAIILDNENVKLGLSTLGIFVTTFIVRALYKLLLADLEDIHGRQVFPPGSSTHRLFVSLLAMSASLSVYAQRRRRVLPEAPLHAYFVIAAAASLSLLSEKELGRRWGMGGSATWQRFIVFSVMIWQWTIMRAKFGWREWATAVAFTVAGIAAAVPWAQGAGVAGEMEGGGEDASGHTLAQALLGTSVAVLFLVAEGLSQTYQDKLYRDARMPVADQVLFIAAFAAAINLLVISIANSPFASAIDLPEALLGSHSRGALAHLAHNPSSLLLILVVALPGAAMVFLMSYMLRLCGALVCVMIHQILMECMAMLGSSAKWQVAAFQWLGEIGMAACLLYTMSRMSHEHHGGHEESKESELARGRFTILDEHDEQGEDDIDEERMLEVSAKGDPSGYASD